LEFGWQLNHSAGIVFRATFTKQPGMTIIE